MSPTSYRTAPPRGEDGSLYGDFDPTTTGQLLRRVAHGLDVVAIRVTDERAVVVLVILGPDARFVQHVSTGADSGSEERPHRLTIGSAERDMGLPKPVAVLQWSEPEVGERWHAVTNHGAELHDPATAERGEYCVVERSAGSNVSALDGQMVEHPQILAQKRTDVATRPTSFDR